VALDDPHVGLGRDALHVDGELEFHIGERASAFGPWCPGDQNQGTALDWLSEFRLRYQFFDADPNALQGKLRQSSVSRD
jgi:hypothetical protein